tara:strand:- start:3 stop:254 length:252 start_codon:yes stop_codon:yes gene_type:complete
VKTQLKRLLRNHLFQITGLTAKVFDFVSRGRTRCVPSQPSLASLHEVLRPFVVDALGNAFTTAQLGNTVFAAQAVQDDPDLLL